MSVKGQGLAPGEPRTRPVFAKLCGIARAHELRVEMIAHVKSPEIALRISDGVDGATSASAPDIAQIDQAAATCILSLAKAGLR